jgi:hypothetical protein
MRVFLFFHTIFCVIFYNHRGILVFLFCFIIQTKALGFDMVARSKTIGFDIHKLLNS